MPTGQVLRWHLRIMMQPAAISGAVAKPNSSAPRMAATATSRPVRSPPSACTAMRPPSQRPDIAGLSALRDLDLQIIGADQIVGAHAKTYRCDLLDRGTHRIAIGQGHEAVEFLAALAGVRFAADAVHGDGQRRMCLAA